MGGAGPQDDDPDIPFVRNSVVDSDEGEGDTEPKLSCPPVFLPSNSPRCYGRSTRVVTLRAGIV